MGEAPAYAENRNSRARGASRKRIIVRRRFRGGAAQERGATGCPKVRSAGRWHTDFYRWTEDCPRRGGLKKLDQYDWQARENGDSYRTSRDLGD